jgi:hypothetical protein
MHDFGKKHRVIGIRHVLRKFKKAGLVEKESQYADEAVADLQDEITKKAVEWYKVGAKRGAKQILGAFFSGDLKVRRKADGTAEIVAKVDALTWEKRLTVSTGTSKSQVPTKTYKLDLGDLDFD